MVESGELPARPVQRDQMVTLVINGLSNVMQTIKNKATVYRII